MTENGIENFTVAPRTIAVGVKILFFSPRPWDVIRWVWENQQMRYDETMRQATKQLKYKMPTLSLCIMCGEGKYRCCYRYLWGWWYSQKAERTWYDDVVLLASVQLQLCSGLLKRLKLSQSRWASDFVKIVKFLPGEPKSIEAQVMRGEIADSVALVAWRRMKQVNKESVLRNHQMSSKSIEDIYESCWNKMKPATLKF